MQRRRSEHHWCSDRWRLFYGAGRKEDRRDDPTAGSALTLKLLRAGIDDPPELGAVLEVLHLRSEAAVQLDPLLHGLRIDRHQLGGSGVARDPDARGPALVEIGLMEAHAGARGRANAVERHDAEHK